MRVVRQADDCSFSTAKVDFLYDYEYVTDGWCKDAPNDKVIVYDRGWINNEKLEMVMILLRIKVRAGKIWLGIALKRACKVSPEEALDSHTDYGWK